MYSNTAPVPFTFLCKWTARIIHCQVSLKKWHWLFFRGGTEVYIVVYTSENLPRQYKSTVYCIFVAIDLGFAQNLHWKLGQQTPSVGTLLAYLETTA